MDAKKYINKYKVVTKKKERPEHPTGIRLTSLETLTQSLHATNSLLHP